MGILGKGEQAIYSLGSMLRYSIQLVSKCSKGRLFDSEKMSKVLCSNYDL